MSERTLKKPVSKRIGSRKMTYWQREEWIRFLWFVIAAAFVVQIALTKGGDKSFY